MLLDGKVAIVSGVGPGLGQANARALAREGATVVLAARSADYLEQVQKEIAQDGGRALAVPTNLVDPDQVAALVARTVDEFGRLDILVNNAFRMDRGEPFETVDLTYWKKVYEVNVWGALGLTQACVPHLRRAATDNGDASIVFILSMSMRKVRLNEGAYSSSKAALRTAVQSLALELGPARHPRERSCTGLDRRPECRHVHRLGVRAARHRQGRRPRRDRGAHPARPHPAAGRHRALGGVLRVAVVERHHRSDPRRERWRVVRVTRPA